MADKAAESRRRDLRPYLYAVLAAIVASIPLIAFSNLDVLYLFIIAPILLVLGLCVLIYAAVRRNRRVAVAVVVFWAASALFFIYPSEIRSPVKWLLWSSEYKKQVLAQPPAANGDFQHVDWDDWGWGGINNTMYLVFDPTDSLAAAARSHQPGKFNGIPCTVPWVRRMQSQWYTVMFYTDQNWSGCSVETNKVGSPGSPQ